MDRIRPPFVRNISAITSSQNDTIYYIDDLMGTLNKITVDSPENLEIVNHRTFDAFQDSSALWIGDNTIQYAVKNELFTLQINDGEVNILSKHILKEMDLIVGLVHQNNLCFVADNNGLIVVYDSKMTKVRSWNVNRQLNSMTFHKQDSSQGLFLLDDANRSIYVYDLQGNHIFSITVPHEGATGIASVFSTRTNEQTLYISYANKTWEVWDNANPESGISPALNIELDLNVYNVFIEKFHYTLKELPNDNYMCLSNGYSIEFKFFSIYAPKQGVVMPDLRDLKPSVRISIPTNTPRQTVVSVESLGQVHGTVTTDDTGEDIIEFAFTNMQLDKNVVVFGYKAVLNLRNIRYKIDHAPFTSDLPDDVKKFLRIERRLDMDRKEYQKIAADILSSMPEKSRGNIISVVRAIRKYVYDKLEFRFNDRSTSPLETLECGEGTCGKYTEVFVGLLRLCGVPCRPVGDYKVPDYKLEYGILHTVSYPDYDHVWLEFYVPDLGWIPMESSADGKPGKYDRFFTALPWIFIENSRTEKSREIVNPGTWESFDDSFCFSDIFKHEIAITVTGSL